MSARTTVFLPTNPEAERAVLGAWMIDPRAGEIAIEMLEDSDFHDPYHAEAFRQFTEIHQSFGEVDFVQAQSAMKATRFRKPDGYLFEMADKIPGAAGIERYCRLVSEAARSRKIVELSHKLQHLARQGASCHELENLLHSHVEASRESTLDSSMDLHDLAKPLVSDALEGDQLESLGLPTRIAEGCVDELLNGLRPNRYVVLAARTGVGKSTFVTTLATQCRANNPDAGSPLILSTEMHPNEIALGAVASAAGVHTLGLLKRNLGIYQREAVQKVIDTDALRGVRTRFMCGASLQKVRAAAIQHKSQHGLPVLIIDLASQLFAPGQDRREKCIRTSQFLAKLKVELSTCIIACVQINRSAVIESKDHRPKPHHIKESGSWEEDADQLVMLHRPAYFGDSDDMRTEVIQWKDRLTANVGSTWIEWKKATGRFEDANRG